MPTAIAQVFVVTRAHTGDTGQQDSITFDKSGAPNLDKNLVLRLHEDMALFARLNREGMSESVQHDPGQTPELATLRTAAQDVLTANVPALYTIPNDASTQLPNYKTQGAHYWHNGEWKKDNAPGNRFSAAFRVESAGSPYTTNASVGQKDLDVDFLIVLQGTVT